MEPGGGEQAPKGNILGRLKNTFRRKPQESQVTPEIEVPYFMDTIKRAISVYTNPEIAQAEKNSQLWSAFFSPEVSQALAQNRADLIDENPHSTQGDISLRRLNPRTQEVNEVTISKNNPAIILPDILRLTRPSRHEPLTHFFDKWPQLKPDSTSENVAFFQETGMSGLPEFQKYADDFQELLDYEAYTSAALAKYLGISQEEASSYLLSFNGSSANIYLGPDNHVFKVSKPVEEMRGPNGDVMVTKEERFASNKEYMEKEIRLLETLSRLEPQLAPKLFGSNLDTVQLENAEIIEMEKVDGISDENFGSIPEELRMAEYNRLKPIFESLKIIPGDVETFWDESNARVTFIDVGGFHEADEDTQDFDKRLDEGLRHRLWISEAE